MDSTSTFDPSTLNQSSLQNMLGGSTPSLIPESLVTTLTVGFIVLNVLGVLFMVFYVINLIRKWRVDSAILHMQKDVAEIKEQLAKTPATPPQPESEPVSPPVVEPVSPGRSSQYVAVEPQLTTQPEQPTPPSSSVS